MNDPPAAELGALFAPARIHLGFLDLHGGLGRKFGSVGLTVEDIGVRLRLGAARSAVLRGPLADRAGRFLKRACESLGVSARHDLEIVRTIPEHVGLGSGTQLGLAVAAAVARLHGIAVSTSALAAVVDRGERSGIGIGAFDRGGFLVDGGRSADGEPAPIIARFDFPKDWRILLTFDGTRNGLHGDAEQSAFAALPPFEEAIAGRLCRVLAMRLLPGVAEADFAAVSEAVAEIQDRIGHYFSPAQNGLYSSPGVAEVHRWLRKSGVVGLGQSSWGPTGFALVESAARGESLLRAARERFGETGGLRFQLVAGRNHGAEIKVSGRGESSSP